MSFTALFCEVLCEAELFFAKYREGKGVKNPITIAAAVALLWGYDIDISKHVIDASAGTGATESSSNFIGRVMAGLLVADGSGAIFNIFTKLGLQSVAQEAVQPRFEKLRVRPA